MADATAVSSVIVAVIVGAAVELTTTGLRVILAIVGGSALGAATSSGYNGAI